MHACCGSFEGWNDRCSPYFPFLCTVRGLLRITCKTHPRGTSVSFSLTLCGTNIDQSHRLSSFLYTLWVVSVIKFHPTCTGKRHLVWGYHIFPPYVVWITIDRAGHFVQRPLNGKAGTRASNASIWPERRFIGRYCPCFYGKGRDRVGSRQISGCHSRLHKGTRWPNGIGPCIDNQFCLYTQYFTFLIRICGDPIPMFPGLIIGGNILSAILEPTDCSACLKCSRTHHDLFWHHPVF